jgi:hypothetical protein
MSSENRKKRGHTDYGRDSMKRRSVKHLMPYLTSFPFMMLLLAMASHTAEALIKQQWVIY